MKSLSPRTARRRIVGSLAATGVLVVASLGMAAPALAAGIQFSITPGGGQQTVGSVSVVVKGTCSDSTLGLVSCDMASLSASISGPDGVANLGSASGLQSQTASITYQWNTTALAKHNGTYTIHASGTDEGLGATCASGCSSSSSVLVNNPPSAPSGVQATLDPSANNTPVVTWNQNPEPDITGYEVFRSANGSAPVALTSAHDASAPQGQALTYLVVAVRSSPVYGSGITSCSGAAPCQPSLSTPGTGRSSAVTVPVPPPAAGNTVSGPTSIATQDPPPQTATGPGGSTVSSTTTTPGRAPLGFTNNTVTAPQQPNLPTKIVQLPPPNVTQFAPLLPYSGKIPEVPTGGSVQPPVQAAATSTNNQTTITVPVFGKVNGVDAAKFFAIAAFLIVGAIHVIRFARRLTHPLPPAALATAGGGSTGAAARPSLFARFGAGAAKPAGPRGRAAKAEARRDRPWTKDPRGPVAPRA